MDEQTQELLQRAEFGRQVELFWGSRIGGYLRDRLAEVYTSAVEELKKVDPEDSKRIRHLQNEIYKASSVEQWLSDAVLDGLKSLEILEGNDE